MALPIQGVPSPFEIITAATDQLDQEIEAEVISGILDQQGISNNPFLNSEDAESIELFFNTLPYVDLKLVAILAKQIPIPTAVSINSKHKISTTYRNLRKSLYMKMVSSHSAPTFGIEKTRGYGETIVGIFPLKDEITSGSSSSLIRNETLLMMRMVNLLNRRNPESIKNLIIIEQLPLVPPITEYPDFYFMSEVLSSGIPVRYIQVKSPLQDKLSEGEKESIKGYYESMIKLLTEYSNFVRSVNSSGETIHKIDPTLNNNNFRELYLGKVENLLYIINDMVDLNNVLFANNKSKSTEC